VQLLERQQLGVEDGAAAAALQESCGKQLEIGGGLFGFAGVGVFQDLDYAILFSSDGCELLNFL
jgi:hypothetical protein